MARMCPAACACQPRRLQESTARCCGRQTHGCGPRDCIGKGKASILHPNKKLQCRKGPPASLWGNWRSTPSTVERERREGEL